MSPTNLPHLPLFKASEGERETRHTPAVPRNHIVPWHTPSWRPWGMRALLQGPEGEGSKSSGVRKVEPHTPRQSHGW